MFTRWLKRFGARGSVQEAFLPVLSMLRAFSPLLLLTDGERVGKLSLWTVRPDAPYYDAGCRRNRAPTMPGRMQKLSQQQLERRLWGAADILRGTVDAFTSSQS